MHTAGLLEAVDLRDVRVIERRERLRLALEPRDALWVGGQRLRQYLDGDLPTECGVGCAVHLTHPANSNNSYYFIATEASAWREGH